MKLKLVLVEVDNDRTSTDADCKKLYKEGSFISTIALHADQILGSQSIFHVSAPDAATSQPLPGGRNDRQFNRDRSSNQN